VSEFEVVLDHACHHGQIFRRDPGAAGSNDVRQFRAFSLALLMGLSKWQYYVVDMQQQLDKNQCWFDIRRASFVSSHSCA